MSTSLNSSFNKPPSSDDTWLRASLTPSIELHYRSANTSERQIEVARLVAEASQLLNEHPFHDDELGFNRPRPDRALWINSLDLL